MRDLEIIRNSDRVYDFKPHPVLPDTCCFLYSFKNDRKHTASVLITEDEKQGDTHCEHASVSILGKGDVIPTWDQMCELKELIFEDEEECYQVFPKKSQYFHGIGNLQNVMHIWRDKE